LLFHITNRYLDLRPVLANLAEKAGLVGCYQEDEDTSPPGKNHSVWAVLARQKEDLDRLWISGDAPIERNAPSLDAKVLKHEEQRGAEPRWRPLKPDPQVGLWTDDYVPLLRVFSW
jgi:hypothetical protein